MKKLSCAELLCTAVVAAAALLVVGEAVVMENEVKCEPTELSPCVGAVMTSQPPSKDCCNKLREQKPCLCGYLKDPRVSRYVNPSKANQVARECKVPKPICG